MISNQDLAKIEDAVLSILEAIGEDPTWEGLDGTPARVARFYKEFFDYDPGTIDTTFEAIEADEMVILKNVPVFSLCSHHILPFRLRMSVGYIPQEGGRILGISKIARIIQKHSHKLQLQEGLVNDVAQEIMELVNPRGVAVVAEGEHLCMQMRGIRSPGTMVTSVMLGDFRDEPECRAEFLRLAGIG